MELAIATDIHGNLPKLERFAYETRDLPPENVFILGDIIHWGNTFQENMCIDLIRKAGYQTVRGNHEERALSTRRAYNIVKTKDTGDLYKKCFPENISFLENLREEIRINGYIFTHGIQTPRRTRHRIRNVRDAQEVSETLNQNPEISTYFVGHAHEPTCFTYDPKKKKWKEEKRRKFQLKERNISIINPGSLCIGTGNYLTFNQYNKTMEWRQLT